MSSGYGRKRKGKFPLRQEGIKGSMVRCKGHVACLVLPLITKIAGNLYRPKDRVHSGNLFLPRCSIDRIFGITFVAFLYIYRRFIRKFSPCSIIFRRQTMQFVDDTNKNLILEKDFTQIWSNKRSNIHISFLFFSSVEHWKDQKDQNLSQIIL